MNIFSENISIQTRTRGLHDITDQLQAIVKQWNVSNGIAFLYVQHTSASLVINENYDPSARRDIEVFLDHIAPDGEIWHEHTLEGSDDSPAHMRTIITHTSMHIPVANGKLQLGTWQGIYLAEHRNRPHRRQVILQVLAEE